MSKYLEFKQIPFKGKTKRFEIISKISFNDCFKCKGIRKAFSLKYRTGLICPECNGLEKIPIILGRISWYPQWRQYTFTPSYPTVWNKDCLNDIIFFIKELINQRKIIQLIDNPPKSSKKKFMMKDLNNMKKDLGKRK